MSLAGRIAVVAGATRGGGRGVALALGAAGATVYCTGRSARGERPPRADTDAPFALDRRPETVHDTAAAVTAAGGRGVAAVVDHTRADEVEALAARIAAEHGGVDILVDSVWGGDELVEWDRRAWELDLGRAQQLIGRALTSHLITARHLTPLMLDREGALVVEVTDGDSLAYRGNLIYDLVKTGVIRLAFALAEELRPRGVTALALTPGFLRSEAMLDHFGVTADTWRDGIAADPHFAYSESPAFLGRAVAALAADPDIAARSGQVLSTWALAADYGFTDADGSTPDWGAHAAGADFGAAQTQSHERFLSGFPEPAARSTTS